MALGGQLILVVMPFVLVVSIGLIAVGLIKRRFAAVIAGVAFPVIAAIVGNVMISSAAANSNDVLASSGIMLLMPYTVTFAVVVFLCGVLPSTVRAARRS